MTRPVAVKPPFESSCQGKKQYLNKREAKAALRALKSYGAKGVEPYRCAYGDHWHLGHRPGAERKDGTRAPSERAS